MKRATLWIDHHKSYILDYTAQGINHREIAPPYLHGMPSKEHLRKYYHDVAQSLKDVECMLVLGPGMAKNEFLKHCEDHHKKLATAIVEVKNMKDHPSFEQIEKSSHDFFTDYMNWASLA
jgi:stalled ribosome rescue protein Dom34